VTDPSTPDPGTAIEIQRLRGDISTGFAEIKGSLALLVQRSDQTDRSLSEHRTDLVDLDKRVSELERQHAADTELGIPARVRTLEAGRWPLPALAGLTGCGALVISLLQFVNR
jgi:hypothetical protein